ncbi:hypothetical protein FRC11_012246 [Ceratobasidium sp. 423]|nr:hypothetical protein FRC11_012246 [Ceratobasidium sp. 423]
MSQELATAGDYLRSALDRYVRACSSSRDACLGGGRLNSSPDMLKYLEKESDDIVSHIQRLEGARAAVQTARNSIPKVAPITALPTEILARIFQLTLPGQSCLVQRGYGALLSGIEYPLYPDALAHVCSFWRRVAIGSPSLWTHIDIALDDPLNPGLFARAKVYATRTGQLPLEIHISDPGSERERGHVRDVLEGNRARSNPHKPSEEWDDWHGFKILPSETIPIKSLEMDLHICGRYGEIYDSVLEYFFAHCKPGVLTKYNVRCNAGWIEYRPFIEPAETPHSREGALLAIPIHRLDEVWLHISSIRVNALCPHWETKAYHGLVELYIDEGIPEISESQLFNILRSSPKLQVFHLKPFLDEPTEDEELENVGRIYLEDLRELNLMIRGGEEGTCASRILRQIAPGSKPLQLSLAAVPTEDLVDFCSRANVTRFYIWCSRRLGPALGQCRRLETLVLNERDLCTQDLTALIDVDDDGDGLPSVPVTPSTTQIDTLYLLSYSKFVFEQIQAVVEKYSIQRLVIYCGKLSYHTDKGMIVSENTRNIRAKLSTITACPTIEYSHRSFCNDYEEGELNDPEGWIRHAARS